MDNTVGRLQSSFPSHQLDVIIGSLLGDGRLECRSIGKRHTITARFRIHHSKKQKKYVFWKYNLLKNLVKKEPRMIMAWHDKKRDKKHYSWYFHTKSLENLGFMHYIFYDNHGVKVIPANVLDILTPRALAIWFMDDGSNVGNSYTLNTHCFSEKEQKMIIDFLKNKYGISATLIHDRSKYKIAIGRNDCDKFNSVIKPHIIPSMNYKIVNPRNDSANILAG